MLTGRSSSFHTVTTTPATALQAVEALLYNKANADTISNVRFVGDSSCIAKFTGGKESVPDNVDDRVDFPDAGVVLSTGPTTQMHAQSLVKDSSQMWKAGDKDLESMAGGTTYDACSLEFDFEVTKEGEISFDYVFGSDEYISMVEDKWNDVFAWFLNEENIALLPDGQPVSIDNVHPASNSDFFVNNDPHAEVNKDGVPFPHFKSDGFTTTLTATGPHKMVPLYTSSRGGKMFFPSKNGSFKNGGDECIVSCIVSS